MIDTGILKLQLTISPAFSALIRQAGVFFYMCGISPHFIKK